MSSIDRIGSCQSRRRILFRLRLPKGIHIFSSRLVTKLGVLLGWSTNSHNSLQYEYEVTCPELDFVVQEGRKIKGVLGIRMTGAGFGGCTVAIIKDEDIDNYIENVGKAFLKEFNPRKYKLFYSDESEDSE